MPKGLIVAADAVYVGALMPAGANVSSYIDGAGTLPGLPGESVPIIMRIDRQRLGLDAP